MTKKYHFEKSEVFKKIFFEKKSNFLKKKISKKFFFLIFLGVPDGQIG